MSFGCNVSFIISAMFRSQTAHLSNQSRSDHIPGEPVLIETSEKQQEELVITCDISKAHAQLRRLKNEGCAIPEGQTIVTAIPTHKSRAMFECIKFPEDSNKDSSAMGYIMFECGLEGISTKIIKRSQFEKSENAENNIKNNSDIDGLLDISAGDKSANTTAGATTTAATAAPSNDASLAAKITESAAKLTGKKPTTPKPTTPREKNLTGFDAKGKEPKEAAHKDNKIKFALKSSDAAHAPQANEDARTQPNTNAGANVSGVSGQPTANQKAMVAMSNNNGRTSSCVIDLKAVWFNFAAPPSVPITRKIDYTRLDWNLLSTASPAITAWMNPSNRFAIKLVAMIKAFHLRRTAVAACLMANGLEVPGVQKKPKSRYSGKFTPLAKTLQEDPSCQLCTVMQRLALQETPLEVEHLLKHPALPQLTTLRQGVIVLSRQWKNMLYNPMLFEHQYKNKLTRPMNVTFAVPPMEEVIHIISRFIIICLHHLLGTLI